MSIVQLAARPWDQRAYMSKALIEQARKSDRKCVRNSLDQFMGEVRRDALRVGF